MKSKMNSLGSTVIKRAVNAVGGRSSSTLKLRPPTELQSALLSRDEYRRFEIAMAKFEAQKAEIVEMLRRSFL